jgi:predicted metal-dependent hydrolase
VENKYSVTIIRSKRKTLAMEIVGIGKVVVKAPLYYSQEKIDSFVSANQDWIESHMKIVAARPQYNTDEVQQEELRQLA